MILTCSLLLLRCAQSLRCMINILYNNYDLSDMCCILLPHVVDQLYRYITPPTASERVHAVLLSPLKQILFCIIIYNSR